MEYIICNLTRVAMKTWKPVWQTGLIRHSIGIQADRNEKGRMGGKSGGEGGMPVAVRRDIEIHLLRRHSVLQLCVSSMKGVTITNFSTEVFALWIRVLPWTGSLTQRR